MHLFCTTRCAHRRCCRAALHCPPTIRPGRRQISGVPRPAGCARSPLNLGPCLADSHAACGTRPRCKTTHPALSHGTRCSLPTSWRRPSSRALWLSWCAAQILRVCARAPHPSHLTAYTWCLCCARLWICPVHVHRVLNRADILLLYAHLASWHRACAVRLAIYVPPASHGTRTPVSRASCGDLHGARRSDVVLKSVS